MSRVSKTYLKDKVLEKAATYGVEVISNRFTSSKTRIQVRCPKCGVIYKTTIQMFLHYNPNGECSCCRRVRGEDHHNYKHLSESERLERTPQVKLKKYKTLFDQTMSLWGGRCCIKPRTRKNNLVAHHLKPWAINPELRYDPHNCVIISRSLHKEFHHLYGYQSTFDDFAEFYKMKTGKTFEPR